MNSKFPDQLSDSPTKLRSIRHRLVWSHLVAVTSSTTIYAGGGFFLLAMLLVWLGGYQVRQLSRLIPQLAGLVAFVLLQIMLITLCGIVVARIASSIVARPMLRQIDELEQGSIDVARGDLHRRIRVITSDELGQLAVHFNALVEHLEDAERQRAAFVANVSHDLRTPIAIIRGHLDAQFAGHRDNAIPIETSLAAIDNEIQTLSRLIDDLFAHSRLEDGVVPIQATAVELGPLIEKSVAGIRAYALTHARVSVHAQVTESLPAAWADKSKVVQIVNNLLHNAVRHTPVGGIVVVHVDMSDTPLRLRTTVRDTGIGIPIDELPYVFDRYYHGADADNEDGKVGSGLGLSIVKRLVELQGGSVGIESTVGAGTAIWFDLPIAALDTEPSGGIRRRLLG